MDGVQGTLREYACTRWPSLNHKGRIWRLKDVLKWTERRTRALYNNEAGMRLRADEMAAIEALEKLGATTDELSELRGRIARLEAALAVLGADLHSDAPDALCRTDRGRGGMGRS